MTEAKPQSEENFVPDMRKSFADNAETLALRGNPFTAHSSERHPDWVIKAMKYMQAFTALANEAYVQHLTGSEPGAYFGGKKQLETLYRDYLAAKVEEKGASLSDPGVHEKINLGVANNVNHDFNLCLGLARDYEASRPKPPVPSKRRALHNIPD